MALFMMMPQEMAEQIASRAQTKRLSLNFSQKTLSDRSGVSLGVIKKFERTGKISLESLLKLALVLGVLEDFKDIFQPLDLYKLQTLAELLQTKTRKRGRK